MAVRGECLTDNVNRAASEMRVLFRKGQLGAGSSVSRDFDHVDVVKAASKDADTEFAASTELPIGLDATQWVSAAALEIARIGG